MRGRLEAIRAARRARAARVEAAVLAGFEVFGDPRMAVPLMTVATCTAVLTKEPCSRDLEREVQQACEGLGARLYQVGGRRLLRGMRRRGQSVAEAVAEAVEHRRWARGGQWLNRPGVDEPEEVATGAPVRGGRAPRR